MQIVHGGHAGHRLHGVAHGINIQPGRHALHVVPGYGHLDIFLGRNAARDVFPGMVAELARPT